MQSLLDDIIKSIKITTKQIGYIEPGHGLKGKNRWLNNDEDLLEMYGLYGKRKEITLWCQAIDISQYKRKRSIEVSTATKKPSTSKTNSIMNTIEEVEKILKTLQNKHAALFRVEQYNA